MQFDPLPLQLRIGGTNFHFNFMNFGDFAKLDIHEFNIRIVFIF